MTTLRQAALDYVQREWAVFPLRERGKDPLVGGAYKVAITNQGQVLAWWAKWPDANIGLATGRPSGLWVLDIDGPQGEASFAELVEEHGGELAETRMASSGKGYHLYWRLPEGRDVGRRIGVRAGLDVIGGSGYLVAPPSIHPSGRVYAWLNPDVEPVEAPEWLFALAQPQAPVRGPAPPRAPKMPVEVVSGHDGIRDPRRYLDGVIRRAVNQVAHSVEGGRNQELFRQVVWAASVAAGLGHGLGEVEASLQHAARLAGLPDEEIEATIRSGIAAGMRNPIRGGG